MSSSLYQERGFFNSLQVFRGMAALLVVFHHQWGAFEHYYGASNELLGFVAAVGKHGVDFFFVLSGFIITISCYDKPNTFESRRAYILNRLLRIYLPFLPISIAMLLLYSLLPGLSSADRNFSWFTSLTLIPTGPLALSVAWTLVHEVMFYTLFLGWFHSRKGWICFTVLWAGIIVYLNFVHGSMTWINIKFLKYFGSFYNLEFLFGFYLALVVKQAKVPSQTGFIIPAIAVFALAACFKWYSGAFPVVSLLFAFSFVFLILGSLNSTMNTLKPGNLLMVLGNTSYSIYLVHNPEIAILVRMFSRLQRIVPISLIFAVIFGICCLTGIIYSKIFEEFLLKKAKLKLFPVQKPIGDAYKIKSS